MHAYLFLIILLLSALALPKLLNTHSWVNLSEVGITQLSVASKRHGIVHIYCVQP